MPSLLHRASLCQCSTWQIRSEAGQVVRRPGLRGNSKRKEGTQRMFYTKPQIVRTDDAVVAIQSQDSSDLGKPSDQFVDQVKACTIGAYEADE
jgi:hypothetical protein